MRITLVILLLIHTNLSAEDYRFASIQSLAEQEVGKLVIPYIYNKLNNTVSVHPLPAIRAEQKLLLGEYDGELMRIFSYGEGKAEVVRVPTPYYTLHTTAFIRKDSAIKLINRESLTQFTIAKVRGVKHTDDITKGIDNVFDLDTSRQMMTFLINGRADIALTSAIDGQKVINDLGLSDAIIAYSQPLTIQPLYHYLHIKHFAKVESIDAVINSMKLSGELAQLNRSFERRILKNTE